MDEALLDETVSTIAIQRLLSAYADAVNRRAWSDFEPLFLAEAPIEIMPSAREPIRVEGATALGDFIGGAIEHFEFFQLVFLNSHIVVDTPNDAATGRNFMIEMRQERGSGHWSHVFGVYHDRYQRADGSWRFAERRFDALAATRPDVAVFDFPGDVKLPGL